MRAVLVFFLISGLLLASVPHTAQAGVLANKIDTMSRLKSSSGGDVLSDHEIGFVTTTGVASGQTIVITMPSDFDGSNDPQGALDFSDVDLLEDTSADGICDGSEAETLVAAGATSSQWNAVFSGTENRILTLTSGGASATIVAASEVCIKIGENATGGSANSEYINPTSSGSKTIALSVGSGADTGDIVVTILDNDQVSVTATVDETLTFTISDNSIGFATLSSSAARYATGDLAGSTTADGAHTIVVGTNAADGYSLSVLGDTLTYDTTYSITALAASTASSAGSEQFGINVAASGGSGAAVAPYATASQYALAANATTSDEIASASGASANTTYTLNYLANISSSTEAGSYSTTLTYIASGGF